MTIACVAFDGIYCVNFLPKGMIITAPCPLNENTLFKQMLWLKYGNDTNTGLFIQHTRNFVEQAICYQEEKNIKRTDSVKH